MSAPFRRSRCTRLAARRRSSATPAVDRRAWGGPGSTASRAREWDAPASRGAGSRRELTFVALPDGTLLVDPATRELAALADALEPSCRLRIAPGRSGRTARSGRSRRADRGRRAARRRRRRRDRADGARTASASLVVDGMPTFGGVPALERLAGSRYAPSSSARGRARRRAPGEVRRRALCSAGTLERYVLSTSAASRRSSASARAGASSAWPSRRRTSPRSSPSSRRSRTTSSAAKTAEFRQRLENGETLEEMLFEAFAAVREARKRESGQRHLRRPADGRDRPPRGRHRRDEDRRGQDVRRHACRST